MEPDTSQPAVLSPERRRRLQRLHAFWIPFVVLGLTLGLWWLLSRIDTSHTQGPKLPIGVEQQCGDVRRRPVSKDAWLPVHARTRFAGGDVVAVHEGSTLTLALDDGTRLVLAARSGMRLLASGPTGDRLELLQGAAAFRVSPRATSRPLRLETRLCAARLDGTVSAVHIDDAGSLYLAVWQGLAALECPERIPIQVYAGQELILSASGVPACLADLGRCDRQSEALVPLLAKLGGLPAKRNKPGTSGR